MVNAKILSYPSRIAIEVTPVCNLACPMCPRNYVDEMNGYMTGELWRKLIDEIAAEAGDPVILPFWRGESLVHPDFLEFMEYAFANSLKIHISTNGELVTSKYAAILSQCEFVTFSIHTAKGFALANEFLRFKKGGKPTVQISFVAGEKTTEKFLSTIVGTRNLGGFDSVRLYEEHSIDGIFGKSGQDIDMPRSFCPKLSDTLVVAADGTISRCNHIWETEKDINLNSQSIKDAWNSAVLQQIRDKYPDLRCEPCDQWTGHTSGESWRIVDGKVEHKLYGPHGVIE